MSSRSHATTAQQNFVREFRASSPYIHAHRQRTFVIFFGGEALLDTRLDTSATSLIHDFALLHSLGIKLVLVHGIRPQIDASLARRGLRSKFHDDLRITDREALQAVKEAAGTVKVTIEALLSLGITHSPMANARVRVVSGNFVMARPIGVINGIDYGYTGAVRRIDHEGIAQQLAQHNVVLVSPIGYSPSGEVFNLVAEQLATDVAIALRAHKLILLTEQPCLAPDSGQLIPQLTAHEAEVLLLRYNESLAPLRHSLQAAVRACQNGVERVHLVDRTQEGSLLLELFTRDGLGTLISQNPYEIQRPARLDDIAGILELITPLQQQGVLKARSREKLEMDIDDYWVIERDGLIIGCAALHSFPEQRVGEIACLAVHHDYRKGARGSELLRALLKRAKDCGVSKIYALSTQTMQWFIERGFTPVAIDELPECILRHYQPARNSKALCYQWDD